MRRLENRVRLIPLVGGRFVISLLSGQQPLREQREAATTSGDVHVETTRSDHAAGCGGVALLLPLSLRAQPAMPVIGFLHSASLEPNAKRLAGFKRGLQSAGFIEGQNVAIEYRWAGGQNAKLPELAAELVKK